MSRPKKTLSMTALVITIFASNFCCQPRGGEKSHIYDRTRWWPSMAEPDHVYRTAGPPRGAVVPIPTDSSPQFPAQDAVVTTPIGSSPPFPDVGLTLKIGSQGPQGIPNALTVQSCPLTLKFEFDQQYIVSGASRRNPLLHLSYSVTSRNSGNDEPNPYFSDTVDLYAYDGPGSLELTPGVYVPPDSKEIIIRAKLLYQKITSAGFVESVSEGYARFPVQPLFADQRYHRYRDGYLRRHLLSMGRGLSEMWLKEYEPGKDPKEMLYHRRCFRVPGHNQTKLYVPWLYDYRSHAPDCPSSL